MSLVGGGVRQWTLVATVLAWLSLAGPRAAAAEPVTAAGSPTVAAAPTADSPVAGAPSTADSPVAEAPSTAVPTPPAPASAPAAALVQQPRPFGYVLGDTLSQRVLLRTAGRDFDPAALPPTERVGLWFVRRSSQIERSADGQRWLVIGYQLINAPQALMTVTLPSVVLKSKAGNGVLVVPEWPISIAPLTPRSAFAKGGLQELRPDHPAPILPTAQVQRQLEIWSAAFGLALAAWLGWWIVRSLRAAANQPFARAFREIRLAGDSSAAAWLALHRAFDRTAGRALQLSTLPALFKQAPYFEAQRAAIERFYDESNSRFFSVTSIAPADAGTNSPTRSSSAIPVGATVRPPAGTRSAAISLRDLAVTLRRIERQHEQ